jgi:hypothetical protein
MTCRQSCLFHRGQTDTRRDSERERVELSLASEWIKRTLFTRYEQGDVDRSGAEGQVAKGLHDSQSIMAASSRQFAVMPEDASHTMLLHDPNTAP